MMTKVYMVGNNDAKSGGSNNYELLPGSNTGKTIGFTASFVRSNGINLAGS